MPCHLEPVSVFPPAQKPVNWECCSRIGGKEDLARKTRRAKTMPCRRGGASCFGRASSCFGRASFYFGRASSCFGLCNGTFRDTCNAYCCASYTLHDDVGGVTRCFRLIVLKQCCIRGFRQGRLRFRRRHRIRLCRQLCCHMRW